MIPLVIAAPWMTVRELAQRSTASIELPPAGREHAVMQFTEPHQVEMPLDGTESVLFEAGRFTVIEAHDRIVTRIHATPQLRYQTFTDAGEHASSQLRRLVDKGFERQERDIDLSTLDDHDRAHVATLVAPHRRWRIALGLRRAMRASSPAAQIIGLTSDAYLVTVLAEPS